MRPIDFLLRAARRWPDQPALRDSERQVSYAELVAQVEALAAAFQVLAPDPRARIAICARNHVTHAVALLATLLAGRIWVPLNPRAGRQELTRIVEFTDAALVIVEPDLAFPVAGGGRTLTIRPSGPLGAGEPPCDIAALIAAPAQRRPERVDHDLAETQAIKFTGGTTGTPKGVMQSYRSWNTTIVSLMHSLRIDEHERYLAVAPLTHGTSTFLLPVLGSGGTLVLSSSTRPREVLDTLERERITSVFMPPTLIYAILDDDTVRRRDWTALRHLIYSAAPMRGDKILEAQAVFGTVETSYGQTEAPAIIAALSPDDARDPAVLQSVGRAGLLTEIAIVDTQGRFLPAGQSGEIVVRGDLVMSGYWRQPDKTAEVLRDGWLRTGDGGYLDERGYLFLKDRIRDLIITGGFNVYPSDVEEVLGRHAAVYDCVVVGIDDDKWGEAVHAAVQLREGATASAKELATWVRSQLDGVKAPKGVHIFDALPRTANGKVSRVDARRGIQRRIEEQDHA